MAPTTRKSARRAAGTTPPQRAPATRNGMTLQITLNGEQVERLREALYVSDNAVEMEMPRDQVRNSPPEEDGPRQTG
ncbi:Hypothetical predicted protein [Cloeon dipterum]|uniref:Uncharacterized protein n=1 Tax=Cloeon dipterum TaxID=197152 RepID=A0A8S1C579_9INSE|nr:Hypothetical predicted protein [Cloeon dipterum]